MSIFNNIGRARVPKSVFDLSYEKKFTADMGQLIPVMCDEVVPGDRFEITVEAVLRLAPMLAPLMHEVNVFIHYFFVAYRNLWEDWVEFITRGLTGEVDIPQPLWNPTGYNGIGSLWDYMGFPPGVIPTGRLPVDYPLRAYNDIWNWHYRDENLQVERSLTDMTIALRNWEKDYLTSALPFQQRGISPALPITISGTTHADWSADLTNQALTWPAVSVANQVIMYQNSATQVPADANTKTTLERGKATVGRTALNNNVVDFGDATVNTMNMNDLRFSFQIQKWMERNARGGVKYNEFIESHFNENLGDGRLQKPEYIGGAKMPLIFSEVLQTQATGASGTMTPQGNMAGHGISVARTYVGKYRVPEFGLIMGLMSVMPKPAYQQGINRQWLRQTTYDYPFPEFVNLSEQAIEEVEVYASAVEADNTKIFGYQGRYDEMRVKHNQVCGLMRTDFDHWHLARQFAAAPDLNTSFIQCVPRKDIFAVPSQPGLFVNVGNIIKAVRPIPVMNNPGFTDH